MGGISLVFLFWLTVAGAVDDLTPAQWEQVRRLEQQRVAAVDQVIGAVVAIYGLDREGGGSGVIIDPSGIALTNHHVIMGAGVEGWGGLADGQLYRWHLIGTDPGGDVALIQLSGRDSFPWAPLGDSDQVHVGDWALAMGNPFILTEDQKPTVTLGIVSGVKRYQPGAGANQLVYGNCIQVDSSINPGNSGGPLFNLQGEVIGINGRGSFLERGRVNVGLGYAISANQIRNFIPDLMATKLVEHGTLDASFSDRNGKVVCSTINRDAPIAQVGLELGDQLLAFEGIEIESANQFTSLICTLPEDWVAHLRVQKQDGRELSLQARLFGLPYARPRQRPTLPEKGEGEPNPEQERALRRAQEMFDLLAAPPGTIRNEEVNQHYTRLLLDRRAGQAELPERELHLRDEIRAGDEVVGESQMWLAPTGQLRIETRLEGAETPRVQIFDGSRFLVSEGGEFSEWTRTQAKLDPGFSQGMALLAASRIGFFEPFGSPRLDGSDEVAGRAAFRIKVQDEERDWFFAWLDYGMRSGLRDLRISKVSADLDGDRKQGAILLDRWETVGEWQIANLRHQVRGLDERRERTWVTREAEVVDAAPGRYEGVSEEAVPR